MNNLIFVIFLLILFVSRSIAQDVIYKTDGEEVKARVLEIGKKNITYKDFNDPDFSTRTIPVEKVKKIRFENGTEKNIKSNQLSSFIGFKIGEGNPKGDFASVNTFNSKAGYARSGPHFQLDFGYYIKKNFGFILNIGLGKNPLDQERLYDPYRNSGQQVEISGNEVPDIYYSFRYATIGPLYSIKFLKRFIFDMQLSTGFLHLQRSSFHIKGDFPNQFYNSYEPAKGTSIGFKFSLGLRFKIFKWLGLRAYSEMLSGHPQLKGRVRVDNYSTVSQKYETNVFNQKFQSAILGLGLTFMFK